MSDFRMDIEGNLLRKDQESSPDINVGDRFFDILAQSWAILLRILPKSESLGAPYEALYDGCDRFSPFIATAMGIDIGEVISENR